jgi:hypothetical protein
MPDQTHVARALFRSLLRSTNNKTLKKSTFSFALFRPVDRLLQIIAQDEFGSTIEASALKPRNVEGTRKMITTLFRHGEKAVTKYENETGEKVDFLDTGFELLKHIGSYTKFVETMVRMYFENIVALFFLFFSVLL